MICSGRQFPIPCPCVRISAWFFRSFEVCPSPHCIMQGMCSRVSEGEVQSVIVHLQRIHFPFDLRDQAAIMPRGRRKRGQRTNLPVPSDVCMMITCTPPSRLTRRERSAIRCRRATESGRVSLPVLSAVVVSIERSVRKGSSCYPLRRRRRTSADHQHSNTAPVADYQSRIINRGSSAQVLWRIIIRHSSPPLQHPRPRPRPQRRTC